MFILWLIQFYHWTFALYKWPLGVYPIFRQPCGHGVMWLGVLFRWGLEITEWSYTMEADLRASKSSKTGWITSGMLDYCRGNLPCVFLVPPGVVMSTSPKSCQRHPAWTRPTTASGVRLFGPEPGWNESDLNHKLHGSCGMGPQLTWVALPSANLLRRRLIESHPITTLTVLECWWQNMAGMTWIWDCDMYGWCIRLSVARACFEVQLAPFHPKWRFEGRRLPGEGWDHISRNHHEH